MKNYSDIPEILYYYCNANEFADIVTNKRFILKDLERCDKFENLNSAVDIINERIRTKESELIKNGEIYGCIPISGLKEQMRKYSYDMMPYFYALILTSNCNKWYMYQKNNADLCIGLRTDLFKILAEKDLFLFKKVIYSVKELENKIDKAIDNYLREYGNDSENFAESFDNIWDIINKNFVYEAAWHKCEYFAEENEYRLILDSKMRKLFLDKEDYFMNLTNPLKYSFGNSTYLLSEIKYIIENAQLISYRYFGYNNLLDLIESVHINPIGQITESDIRCVISANKAVPDNVKIEKTLLK